MEEKNEYNRWYKPVIRLGVWTNITGIILMFIPGIYMILRYDSWCGFTVFGNVFMIALIYFGVNWFVEPMSYFPPLGIAGLYMGYLSGAISSIKIPAAVIAKSEQGVKDGSKEGELVTVYALYGATVVNALIITLIALLGSLLLKILPDVVRISLATYVMPCLFGAMLAMFGCEMPLLMVPVFAVMIILHIVVSVFSLSPVIESLLPLISVVGSAFYARFLYKKGKIFSGGIKGGKKAKAE